MSNKTFLKICLACAYLIRLVLGGCLGLAVKMTIQGNFLQAILALVWILVIREIEYGLSGHLQKAIAKVRDQWEDGEQ